MKINGPSVLAGAAVPLVLADPAAAGFVGIKSVIRYAFFGGQQIGAVQLYATFDRPGQDLFLAAAGTPNSPMDIHVRGGPGATFYQHPFGGDTAPNGFVVGAFPSLGFDTFVTIGVKQLGTAPGVPPGSQSPDNLVLTPGWPGFGPSSLTGNSIAWAVTPVDAQSDPFNPNFANGNGQVLIGQFSAVSGPGGVFVTGMLRVQVRSNNVNTLINVTFFAPTPATLPLLAVAGLFGTRRRVRVERKGPSQ